MQENSSSIMPEKLNVDLSLAFCVDRFALRKRLQKLAKLRQSLAPLIKSQSETSTTSLQNYQQQLKQFNEAFERSCALVKQRQALAVHIDYPSSLPVSQQQQAIAELIEKHQVIIVAGETGSGKTTQLAKICLGLGRGRSAMIAHTQPRRVAASSVATRIAEELQVELGQQVGYQIRFQDSSNENTLLKLMTDGVLLAEIPHDRFLQKYDTIIIDEAHERSLNIDFLLGYIKSILPKRPDLKVIITSATIDVNRFSKHFSNAPIKSVTGRTYPVDMLYRPVADLSEDNSLPQAILSVLDEIGHQEKTSTSKGDVLVFLPGEHDIRQASLLLRRSDLPQTEVLPLYARLNNNEHQKIFQPKKKAGRRIILATNVAETSLTVPGIRYVIDSGLVRISRYSHRSKIQRLPVEPTSQASANQRAGRCGRIAAGLCYRLYSEEDFLSRTEFTQPEIQRTNLSAVILQMAAMRLGDIESFPFVEAPDQRLINDGVKQLLDIDAINSKRQLTKTGEKISKLPIDPRLAAMLLQANKEASLKELLVIVAALSVQDPRENPAEKREAAREQHSRFKVDDSDFMSLYVLWNYLEEKRQELSNNQFRRLCQKEFLAPQRVREWRETHAQLRHICKRISLIENTKEASSVSIHRALLAGLLTQVGFQQEQKVFEGVRNRQFKVFPASFLAKKPPKWIMAAELIETSQLFAHSVAKIDPLWIKDLAAHLLKYSYSEPHWSQKQGQVMAYQQSSLYGLIIEEKQAVPYSQIDVKASHDIFIRSALVEEQMRSNAPFYKNNISIHKNLLAIEEKSRRRDVIANDERIYQFYAERIPEHVVNVAGFERWRKKAEKQQPRLLFADVSHYQASDVSATEEQYPSCLNWKDVDYQLRYRFQPGHEEDGISLRLPVTLLNRVPKFRFEWLVPGLFAEKCEALLRSLPKQYRRSLVPIPDTVLAISKDLEVTDMPLHMALTEQLQKIKRITIPADAWQLDTVDAYYHINFQLIGDNGSILEQSRDLAYLLKKYAYKVQQALNDKVDQSSKNKRFTRWDFDDLATQQAFTQGRNKVQSYPALQDNGDNVSLVLTDYAHVQAKTHKAGLVRLAMLELSQSIKYLRKELLKDNTLKLKLSAEFDLKCLLDDLLRAAVCHTFFAKQLPFVGEEYKSCLQKKRAELTQMAKSLESVLMDVVSLDYQVRQQLSALKVAHIDDLVEDIQYQRKAMFYQGFLYSTPLDYLFDLKKYFTAISLRLDRLQANIAKDRQFTEELASLHQQLADLETEYAGSSELEAAIEYRWMLEEYRVSLFAQQLKTKKPISAKRLQKQWQKVLEQRRNNII